MRLPATVRVGPWRFRRSLAGRVTALTILAVGLTTAFLAAGVYLTVRMQLQTSLDDSLLNRAQQAAASPALATLTTQAEIPAWALGAGDIRIAFITSDQRIRSPGDRGPTLRLGQPELLGGRREVRHQHPHDRRRHRAVPSGDGAGQPGR